MFNNINNNNGFSYGNSQLNNASNVINLASIRANLQKSGYASSPYVDSSEISEGVVDIFEDDVLKELVNNQKLWDDLNK